MTTKTIGACVGVLISASAFAKECTIRSGATDWTSPGSYSAGGVPVAGDTVLVPDGATVYLSDSEDAAASWELASSLGRIVPKGTSARIEITVEGERELNVPISFYRYGGAIQDYNYGPVVKKGAGTLSLNSQVILAGPTTAGDCYAHYSVEAGTLKLQQKNTVGNILLGVLDVAEGATLCLPTGPALGGVTNTITGISGKGTVRAPTGLSTWIVFNGKTSSNNPVCVFEGDLLGVLSVDFNGDCQGLTGPRNDFSSFLTPYNSTTVIGFGPVMGATTSDVGCLGTFANNENKGYMNWQKKTTFRYLGDVASTVWRNFFLSANGADRKTILTFDGGAFGGLSFGEDSSAGVGKGTVQRNYKATSSAAVCLTGDHANECALVGDINDNWDSTQTGAGGHTIRFIKEGSGAWRFADPTKNGAARNFVDVLDIREGALRFDSIDEAGRRCALGLSTLRTDGSEIFSATASSPVDYAYLMGAPKFDGTTATTATLEYSSTTEHGRCTTRPIALAGHGGLANSSAKTIKFANVYGLSDTDMTFTLSGSNTGANEIADISDGTGGGKVTVVKAGSGTWTLSGEQTFGGDLVVTGGTLVVRNSASKRFTWFRLTAKGLYNRIGVDVKAESTPSYRLQEFGLFDKDGARLNYQMSVPSDAQFVPDGNHNYLSSTDWVNLQPGEAAIETRGRLHHLWGMKLGNIFDSDNNTTEGLSVQTIPFGETVARSMKPDDPKSHIVIVMRLKADCTAMATTFDYMARVNTAAIGASDHNTCTRLRAYSLEGSVDGLHWEKVCADRGTKDDDSDCDPVRSGGKWAYNNSGLDSEDGVTRQHWGFPLTLTESALSFSVLERVQSVQVSSGATLKMEAGSVPVTIGALRVDAASGGTIEGFAFDDAGEMDVVNASKGKATDLPITFKDCGDISGIANWSVSVGGVAKPNYSLSVRDGKVTLHPSGIVIIVR